MKQTEKYLKVKLAGFNDKDTLLLSPERGWECGDIKNGIHATFKGVFGSFVIDFKSLKAAIERIETGSEPEEK